MSAGSDLYDLLKSLEQPEKRYFLATVRGSGGASASNSLYLRVFRVLSSMTAWNRDELLQKVNDPSLEPQLAVLINYLHRQILSSLASYHQNRHPDFKLKAHLMNVELLLERNLNNQARKELERARKLAIRYERFEYFGEIHSQQINLALRTTSSDLDKLNQRLQELLDETSAFSARFINMLAYRQLSISMMVLSRRQQQADVPEALKLYEELLNRPALLQLGPPASERAQMSFLQSKAIFSMARQDWEHSCHYYEEIVNLLEQKQELIEERPGNYLASLQNLLTVSLLARPLAYSLALVDRLKNIPTRMKNIRFSRVSVENALLFAWHHELNIYLETGDIEKARPTMDAVAEWMAANEKPYSFNEGYVIYAISFNLAQLLLINGRPQQAQHQVNRILNSGIIGPQFEMYINARLMQLVIYLEREDYSLLEYEINSYMRFLHKQGNIHPAESAFLQFLRKAVQGNFNWKKYSELHRLQEELSAAMEDGSRPASFSTFNVPRWVARKLVAALES